MARSKRKTPFDPAASARAALLNRMAGFEAIGLQPEAAALPVYDSIELTRAGETRSGKKVEGDAARRLDVFEALRPSMNAERFVGAYDAARRLERDILVSLGQHDHGRPIERVDGEFAAFCRADAMIDASKRVMRVRDRLAERDVWLLWELIAPTRPWPTWRSIVAHITAETNFNAQGAAVRAACVNLRDTYERLDVVRQKVA
jgi:hypothetical protein